MLCLVNLLCTHHTRRPTTLTPTLDSSLPFGSSFGGFEVEEAEAQVQAVIQSRKAAEQTAHEKRLRKEARAAEKRRCEAMVDAESCAAHCWGCLMDNLDAHIDRRVAQPLFDCRAVLTGLGERPLGVVARLSGHLNSPNGGAGFGREKGAGRGHRSDPTTRRHCAAGSPPEGHHPSDLPGHGSLP